MLTWHILHCCLPGSHHASTGLKPVMTAGRPCRHHCRRLREKEAHGHGGVGQQISIDVESGEAISFAFTWLFSRTRLPDRASASSTSFPGSAHAQRPSLAGTQNLLWLRLLVLVASFLFLFSSVSEPQPLDRYEGWDVMWFMYPDFQLEYTNYLLSPASLINSHSTVLPPQMRPDP
ncbi:uncharacterized protein TRIREDRAFT_106812 [Trichoderma reesei QM6a]|uniref:Predicted protein n=1 Tax=Hypocrea jecorina (strain QM6a) TaxID=431241 RepID=G0RHY4_HYPJQ|nr:uncharacterized protein TRIREDRAFT_106812 [Trichoderma reesei QM6a]EGR49085.1 predicted protein [Trichoderma reesei QM6a]